VSRSPWWYRYRALTIGGVYVAAFFIGPLISVIAGWPVVPLLVVLGAPHGPIAVRALLVLAVLLAATCWALRTWGSAYLRPATVWSPDALDDRLIVAGPFRFVRNPLYLGNVLLALGMSLYATPLGAILVIIGNVAVVLGLMSVEEALMRERYGAAFAAYRAAVPALWWRITPWHGGPSGEVRPSYRPALRSELFSAAFVAVTIAIAVRYWNGAPSPQ
jgi:protein-S-isoprenylcysteine O-methyltransferase Ste14